MMKHRHSQPLHLLPQCPLLADTVISTFEQRALYDDMLPRRATTHLYFLCGHSAAHPALRLYSPDIICLLILHQGQHHFHTNYRRHGNCPKEVITQVISVTDDERLAQGQVLFIRGQVAFRGNTLCMCNKHAQSVNQHLCQACGWRPRSK